MRRIAALASSLIVVLVLSVSAEAASLTPEAIPFAGSPEVPGSPPPALADRDGDGLSDDFQAKLATARPGDQFDVIVRFSGPGDALSTQQAVGPFRVRREFNIISGFAAAMTAAQIQGLAGSPGVFRIEEDFEVRAYLESARPDFGVDGAVDLFGFRGDGVGICVVDTGIDNGHEQLDNGKVVGWLDMINGQPDPYDDHGHGTHVASIAAGDGVGGPNAAKNRGVAPDASLYGAKVLNSAGSGAASDIIAAIGWCAGQAGVDIINLSLGGLNSSDGKDALSTATNCAADPGWTIPGTTPPVACPNTGLTPKVVVLAAGNAGPAQYQISSPAAAERPITVAAVAAWSAPTNIHRKGLAAFSSRGPTQDERVKPDISAPGVNITAAKAGENEAYITFNGTSMATPFVAGTAALILDANPGLTPQEVKDLLHSTAQYRGEPNPQNKNIDWGWGLVDVFAAVAQAAGVVGSEPTGFPTYVRIDDTIPDFTDWTYDFDVVDPDTPIAVTITNGGTWNCLWFILGNTLNCLTLSSGSDLDAELIDPDGILVDESTCWADSDTFCGSGQGIYGPAGTGGRQETLLAPAPVKTGTWTVRIYPFDGDALDLEPVSTVGVDLSTGPLGGTGGGTPANNPPVAMDDAYSVNEDTTLSVAPGVLGNDSDADGDPLTAVLASGPTNGALTLNADGSFTYTPNADFTGPDQFTYKANDGTADSNTATVAITVSAANDAPVANGQNVSTSEDTAVAITLTGSDVDGDALTFAVVGGSGPTNGVLSGTAPTLTYTPNAGYSGADSFTFTASDGLLTSAAATVSITVNAFTDPPVADAQSVSTSEDTAVGITLTGSDPDGDALTFAVVTAPAHGSLSGTAPNLTYTPDPNYNGADGFTFTASDASLTSAAATVSITVNAVNDAPVADAQSVSTSESTAVAITLTGSDADGDALTFAVVGGSGPTNGVLSGTAPNLTYTPNAGYNGADGFSFTASDAALTSAAATVSITVNAVNDPPVVVDQTFGVFENAPEFTIVGTMTFVASDPDGDPLTFAITAGNTGGAFTINTVTGLITVANSAALDFEATPSFALTVEVADNGTPALTDTATVTVNLTDVNEAPTGISLSSTTVAENAAGATVGTLSVTDPDAGDSHSFTVSDARFEVVSDALKLKAGQSLDYETEPTVSLTVTATDSGLLTFDQPFTITVTDANEAPVAMDDAYSVNEDATLSVAAPGVLGNDSDADGDPLSAVLVTGPTNGALTLNANGSFTYAPNADFTGPDQFTYKANDGTADSSVATVAITVSVVNNAPVADAQSVSTSEDTAVAITLTGSDPDGDALTYAVVTLPAHGSLSGTAPNLTYTPDPNYSGADGFTFTASDGLLTSAAATVSITVNAVNDAPVADAQSVTTNEDTAVGITLTGSDVDGDALTFAVMTEPTSGVLSGTAPNLTYTPNPNYNGSDSFTFKANDGVLDSNVATVSITVNPVVAQTMHVGDLDGFSTNLGKMWTATVTATVHDASDNPLDGATVDGTWSGGYSGTASCTTSGGQCQVTSGSIRKKIKNVTFTVNTITHNPLTYDSAANHDPDGDSTGASITVSNP